MLNLLEKHSYKNDGFNEQTELTSKIETDSQMESRVTAKGRRGRGQRYSAKRKKDSWSWTTVW